MGVSMLCMMYLPQTKNKVSVVYSGTIIFVMLIILGLLGIDLSLIMISKKMKQNKLIICIVTLFIFSLMMGYLSNKDFTLCYMNWIGKLVNIIGRCLLYFGVKSLDKNGLNELIKEN